MPEKPKPAPKTRGTKYVVLAQRADGQYVKAGTFEAPNDVVAIRQAHERVEKEAAPDGPVSPTATAFVAVPQRSFKLRSVTVQTVTRTKIA